MKPIFYTLVSLIFGLAGCAADDFNKDTPKDSWRLAEPTILTHKGVTDSVFQPRDKLFSLEDSLSFEKEGVSKSQTPITWTVDSRCDHAVSGERSYTKRFSSQERQFRFRDLLHEEALILSVQNPGALRCYFSIAGENSSGSTHRFDTPWMVFSDADQAESPALHLVHLEDGRSLSDSALTLEEDQLSQYSVRGLPDQPGEVTLSCETFTSRLTTQSLRLLNLKDLLSMGDVEPASPLLPWHTKPLQNCRLVWKQIPEGQITLTASHPFRFSMEPVHINARWRHPAAPKIRQYPARHPLFPKSKKKFQAYGADLILEVEISNPNSAPVRIRKIDPKALRPTGKIQVQSKIGKKAIPGELQTVTSFRADRSTQELDRELEIPPGSTAMIEFVFEYGFICYDLNMMAKIDQTALGSSWTLAQNLNIPVLYANEVHRTEVPSPAAPKSKFKFTIDCEALNYLAYAKR